MSKTRVGLGLERGFRVVKRKIQRFAVPMSSGISIWISDMVRIS